MFSYQTITLTATGSGGSFPTRYRWYRNNVIIPGATGSTYVYTPAETANERDNYTFYCLISNAYNSTDVKSNELSVIVEQATLGTLKGIPLRKDDGEILYVAAQNLGQESSTDGGYTGDLYQYGRADDGHEKQNSPLTTTQATNGVAPYEPEEVRGKYINHDPWSSDPDFATGWTSGTHDPCPAGWHLPSYAEWRSITHIYDGNPTGSRYITLTFDEQNACFFITDGQHQVTVDLNVMRNGPTVSKLLRRGEEGEYYSRLWTRDYNMVCWKNYDGKDRVTSQTIGREFRGHRVRCVHD
jgi:uncharacterized protein (TIGR02145 family)